MVRIADCPNISCLQKAANLMNKCLSDVVAICAVMKAVINEACVQR